MRRALCTTLCLFQLLFMACAANQPDTEPPELQQTLVEPAPEPELAPESEFKPEPAHESEPKPEPELEPTLEPIIQTSKGESAFFSGEQERVAMDYDQDFVELMPNAIDQVFERRMEAATCVAEEKMYRWAYRAIWQHEFINVMEKYRSHLEENGGTYLVDDYVQGVEEQQDSFMTLMNQVLNDFKIRPGETGGVSTAGIAFYQGMMYRDSCLYLMKFLPDGYELPTEHQAEVWFDTFDPLEYW